MSKKLPVTLFNKFTKTLFTKRQNETDIEIRRFLGIKDNEKYTVTLAPKEVQGQINIM